MLPLSIPPGFSPESADLRASFDFSRTGVGGLPVGAGAWTLDLMRLEQGRSASLFQPSTFSVDIVSRGNLVTPISGLFNTSFADLQPLTIAQGLAVTDK